VGLRVGGHQPIDIDALRLRDGLADEDSDLPGLRQRTPDLEPPVEARSMADKIDIACRKCGAVLRVEVQVFGTQVTIEAKDNVRFQGEFRRGIDRRRASRTAKSWIEPGLHRAGSTLSG